MNSKITSLPSSCLLLPSVRALSALGIFSISLISSVSAADVDADGMDDAWEIQHFGNLSAMPSADPDGDGRSNFNEQDAGSNPTVRDGVPGSLFWEKWNNGSDFRGGKLMQPVQASGVVPSFGGLVNQQDNFIDRYRGWVTAPVTGNYTFTLSSDDDSELWLSTDGNPLNRRRVAYINGFHNRSDIAGKGGRNSPSIPLQAGQSYYLEVVHADRTGGDHAMVSWNYSATNSNTLPQIPMWTNWAREAGVTATQSSTYSIATANKAIDGERNGAYLQGSVTHTNGGNLAWWNVDLGTDRPIDRVVIFNRTEEPWGDRLSNFRVSILDAADQVIASRDYLTKVGPGVTWALPQAVQGRKVKIELLGPNARGDWYLQLAEVEVIGVSQVTAPAVQAKQVIPSPFLSSYVKPLTDLDDDQLPDAWEIAHGINATTRQDNSGGVYADTDQDGIPLWVEAFLNLNPNQKSVANGYYAHEQRKIYEKQSLSEYREKGAAFQPALKYDVIRPEWNETTGCISEILTQETLRARITAPVSGNYRFWVSGLAGAELWLSTDHLPFQKRKLAEISKEMGSSNGIGHDMPNRWDVYASQMSDEVYLQAGQTYYLEANHIGSETYYSSHLSLAWAPPGQARSVIPASAIQTYERATADADDDRLLDSWEAQYGLSVTDNGSIDPAREGEWGDFDQDGLCNREEYQLGTNPANADTDGDGLKDGEEVRSHQTNPLSSDVRTADLIASVPVSSYTASSTSWTSTGEGIVAEKFRGNIAWGFSTSEAGHWLIQVETRFLGDLRQSDSLDVLTRIDGKLVSRQDLTLPRGQTGTLRILTPYLAAGSHTLDLFIDNLVGRRNMEILSVNVLRPSGVDLDGDGLADWVESQMGAHYSVNPHPSSSYVSPAFIEGTTRSLDWTNLQSNGSNIALQQAGAPGYWMANLPLLASGATAYQATFEGGNAHQVTGSITWQAREVYEGGSIDIRVGDTLKLSANAPDASAVNLVVLGQSHNLTAGQSITKTFPTAGTYVAQATSANGATQSVQVKVHTANFGSTIYAMCNAYKEVTLPNVPHLLPTASKGDLKVTDRVAQGNGTKLKMFTSVVSGERQLLARLFSNGPVVSAGQVRTVLYSSATRNDVSYVSGEFNDFYVLTAPFLIGNMPPGGYVKFTIFRAGVTFEDGSTTKIMTESQLPADGVVELTYLIPKTSTGGYCHTVSFYDASGQLIR